MATHSALRAALLALFLLPSACRRDPVAPCLELLDGGRHEEALAGCAAVYDSTGEPRAGVAAAKAAYRLGRGDEALAWVARVAATGRPAPGLLSVAAGVHAQRGEVELAAREHRRDLAVCRAAGDHRGAAVAAYGLFYLAWPQSRYREALAAARTAFEEAGAAGDHALRARAAEALYTVLYAVGDLGGAGRALDAAEAIGGELDPLTRARLLANRGTLQLDAGRPALARRHVERALALAAGQGDSAFFRPAHLKLVEAGLAAGDVAAAARHLDLAWEHAEPGRPREALLYYRALVERARGRAAAAETAVVTALAEAPSPDWAWDLELLSGRLAEERGDPGAAEAAYERSAAIVEEMRRSLAFDAAKAWLLDRRREPFEALLRLRARAGRAMQALAAAERLHARALVDAVVAAGGAPQASRSADDSADRLEALGELLPAMSASPVAAAVPVEELLTAFGDRRGLVYTEAGGELWLAAVGTGGTGGVPGAVRLWPLGPASEVAALVDRLAARPADAAAAARLGGLLLPDGALPPPGGTLHIVPDGPLARLPFAALRRGGRFLVEDHALALAPSLTALAAIERLPAGPAGPPVVLADPRSDLPAAAAEAVAVGASLGVVPRVGPAATRAELGRAAGARALHLATHAGVGPRGAWLALADGEVAAPEIVAGRIAPRLVALASCASAAREGRETWGSLAAAFLAAGSRAVLAALWSVEDEPTRRLMVETYAAGWEEDPAAALARAQRVAISRGASPHEWAPFVLVGSSRPPPAGTARTGKERPR